MHGENLSRLGVQLDFFVHADINLGEIILVEVGLQHFISLDNTLFFQLFACTKHKPSGVKLFVLAVDYLRFLRTLGSQVVNIGVQVVDSFIQLGDVDILRIQFGTQFLKLLVFLFQLSGEAVQCFFQAITFHGALLELVTELGNQFAVTLHGRGDELDILTNLLPFVGTLTFLGYGHPVFCRIDFLESLLDFVECTHHVINFVVFLTDDLLQRIGLRCLF